MGRGGRNRIRRVGKAQRAHHHEHGKNGGATSLRSFGHPAKLSQPPAISTTILPVVTCSPSAATSIDETVPATPAVCTCSIFIASSVITADRRRPCSPGLTSTATTRPFMAAATLPSPPFATRNRCCERQVDGGSRITPAIAGYRDGRRAEELYGFHHTVRKEADRIAAEFFVDFTSAALHPANSRIAPVTFVARYRPLARHCPSSIPCRLSENVAARLRPLRQGGACGLVT